MNRYLSASAVIIAGLLSVSQANAQLAVAKVVANCGTVSPTPHAGSTYALTMDVTGTLCTVGGGGGGGGTSSNFGTTFPGAGTAAGFKDPSNNMAAAHVDTAGNILDVGLSFHSSGHYVNAPTITTSANNALTGFVGPNALLKNYGTTQIAFHQAASSTTVTIATADGIIEPGGTWQIALGTTTNIAVASVVSGAISGTGSLQIIDGTGNWSGSGGGGGGSSGGTVAQGNTGSNAQSWWMQIGDGTHGPAAVKPASTAAVATDPALVVTLSPNSPGVGNVFQATAFAEGSVSSSTTTQVFALSGTTTIYLVNYAYQTDAAAAGNGTFQIITGTGTNCAVVNRTLTPVWNFAQNAGIAEGPIGVLGASAAGDEMCIKTTGGANTINYRIGIAQQ